MRVRIVPIEKTTTQSGRAYLDMWKIEAELETPRVPDAVMGWVSAGDTLKELRMHFDSQDAAESFAKSQGWDYTISERAGRIVRPRNYGDNFKYVAVDDE